MNSQTTFSKAIIGKALTFSLALCLTGSAALFTTTAYAQDPSANVDASQDGSSLYSADDLDNLLAPIALYPDPLLAQVLVAATFDDQIQDASQLLSAGAVAVDDQPWDDSVKAVAHYPKVLFTLAAQPDWTSAIGQAYVTQSTDVMNSIQRLRSMALEQGNLVSNQQQLVAASDGAIQILPARAGYVFLPAYDPAVVFSAAAFISFGPALAIDGSCNDQIDWHQHHIFDGHHHDVRTGDRGSRGRIRNARERGRFNPGARRSQEARGPVNRGRYNPGFTRGAANHGPSNAGFARGAANHGRYNPGFTRTRSTNNGSTKMGSTKPTSTKPTSTKPASTKPTSTKPTSTKPASTKPASTKPASTNAASTHAPVNRGQSNPGVNRGQVSRTPAPSMNRGSAPARSAGKGRR